MEALVKTSEVEGTVLVKEFATTLSFCLLLSHSFQVILQIIHSSSFTHLP